MDFFIKQLDDVETTKENEANFLGVEFETIFPQECQRYRWSKNDMGTAKQIMEVVDQIKRNSEEIA